ncbi:hypothetical protein Ae201684_016999 [Aphanomyces euteiches]|uniref:Uncharacterized protein n=1 Tax=Aphanomyces euteiches TaxID=100861 RepID=A0A6G0WAR8_9STRA|nr:hypothetical protein Ae201684_016999 [Aphanomyces euteiches]KAH9158051.1 hypothetical protein AeRB84_000186 [Aphanomyces euteiches]
MCKPRHHATAITVRVNRLKLKIKQLRATRDELIAIANRLVELQEDLIAEKSKMEKVKDEALGRLEAELNEAKCRLSESQLRHQELMDQKDVLDSLPLESETTPYSGEAHLESTPDSNCDVTPHNSFDDKTIICGKLETITQGSEEACVHPPPRHGGRMPTALVMQKNRLNFSRKATKTEDIARLNDFVHEEAKPRAKTAKIGLLGKETHDRPQLTRRRPLGRNDVLIPTEREQMSRRPSPQAQLSRCKEVPGKKTQNDVATRRGIRACVSPREIKPRSRRVYEQLPEAVAKKQHDELERKRKSKLEDLQIQRQEQLRQKREQSQASRRDNKTRPTKATT